MKILKKILKKLLDRQVEIDMKIYQLKKEQNKKLNEIYFKYFKSNLNEFYKKVFEIIEDIDTNFQNNSGKFLEKRKNLEGDEWDKGFYTLKYRLDKKQYTKLYNYQRNIEKQGSKKF